MGTKNDRPFWSLGQAMKFVTDTETALDSFTIDSHGDRQRFAAMHAEYEALRKRVSVETAIGTFVNELRSQQWPSAEQFMSTLLDFWFRLLEHVYALYDRPVDALRCNDQCVYRERSIVAICSAPDLYGCTVHGTIHHCSGRDCRSTITTSTWTKVCMFSGAEVGREFSNVASVASEYRSNSGKAGFRSFAAREQEDTVIDEFDNSGAVSASNMQRWREQIARGELLQLGDPMITAEGGIRGPTNLEKQSFRFGRRVSEIHEEAERKLVSIAENVITDVLFVQETRMLLNIQRTEETNRTAMRKLVEYHSQCRMAKIVPNRIDSAATYQTPFKTMVLLPILANDLERRVRMVRLCVKLWGLCHRTPYVRSMHQLRLSKHAARQSTCTFVQFCLAVLYAHRSGYSLIRQDESCFIMAARRHVFVPHEMRMMVDLPHENQIDVFGAKSTERMRNHVAATNVAETVSVGSNPAEVHIDEREKRKSIDADLFKSNGTLKARKRRHRRRQTTSTSGTKQITMRGSTLGGRVSAAERDVLPSHLHSSLVGEPGVYEKADVTCGRNFLRACINSISPENIEAEARSLQL